MQYVFRCNPEDGVMRQTHQNQATLARGIETNAREPRHQTIADVGAKLSSSSFYMNCEGIQARLAATKVSLGRRQLDEFEQNRRVKSGK